MQSYRLAAFATPQQKDEPNGAIGFGDSRIWRFRDTRSHQILVYPGTAQEKRQFLSQIALASDLLATRCLVASFETCLPNAERAPAKLLWQQFFHVLQIEVLQPAVDFCSEVNFCAFL